MASSKPVKTTSTNMCKYYPEEPAVYYVHWDWGGDPEPVCQAGAQRCQQIRANTKRGFTLATISDAPETPISRSERQQLIAAKLAAEADADDQSKRAAKMYEEVKGLKSDLAHERKMRAEAEQQVKDKQATIDALEAKLGAAEKNAADLTKEVTQIKQTK